MRGYRVSETEVKYEAWEDDRWENGDFCSIGSFLTCAVLKMVLQLPTAEAWDQFRDHILAEKVAQHERHEQHRAMWQQVDQFWQLHFPDLMKMNIELPLFHKMELEVRIAHVLADADPVIVQMMHAVGVPGLYSNNVRERIMAIVRRANE